jgi:putative oxidoreductase
LPGAGLLFMRLVAGSVLVYRGIAGLTGALIVGPTPVLIAKIVLGLLLILGLWTPVAGALVAMLEIGILAVQSADPWIHLLLTTLGISLSLLGPGVWSIDARLFGWKRVDIRDQRSRRPRSSER